MSSSSESEDRKSSDGVENGETIVPFFFPKLITDEEQEMVDDIKSSVVDAGIEYNTDLIDDYYILRFLRARDLDLEAATSMFINHIKWRKEVGADTIIETLPKTDKHFQVIDDYWPGASTGPTRTGCRLWVDRIGSVDVKGLINQLPEKSLIDYHIYWQETCLRALQHLTKENGEPVYQEVIIEDLKGMGWNFATASGIAMMKKVIEIDEAHYPEKLQMFFVLNAPKIFSVVYKLLAPFTDPRTLEKVKVFSSMEEAKVELLKVVDAKYLPKEYGGECEARGPGLLSVGGGGKFKNTKADGTRVEPTTVSISRRSRHKETLNVEIPRSNIIYEFSLEGANIGFSIYKSVAKQGGKKETKEDLIRMEKVSADDEESMCGSVLVEEPGSYVVEWDNSFSKLSSKKVTFHLSILPPLKEEEESKEKEKKKKSKKSKKSSSSKKSKKAIEPHQREEEGA